MSTGLPIALYLYAYYLAVKNRFLYAFVAALIASFLYFSSVPVAVALFILFLLQKEWKKAAVLFIPNVIYSCYYIYVVKILREGVGRIPEKVSLFQLVRQYVLQVGSFIDATLGVSMLMKLWYSILALTPGSLAVGCVVLICYHFYVNTAGKVAMNGKLMLSLIVLMLASFGTFAITGYYPQLAFNLGNRTTIYGSLLLVYILLLLPIPKLGRTAVVGIFLFSALGISDHWKAWSSEQIEVYNAVKSNSDLANFHEEKIFVSGKQYSQLGSMNHIEFLSENWVPLPFFAMALGREIPISTLNRRFVYEKGELLDNKYNASFEVGKNVYVYDADNDRLLNVKAEELNKYIESLPKDTRHWVQSVENKTLKRIILWFMPRLAYIY